MDNKEKWEPCPRCGSNKVEARGGCFFALLGFVMMGVFIWIALLFPIIGIPGVILGLVLLVASPFMKGNLQCKDCNKSWKYPAEKKETTP